MATSNGIHGHERQHVGINVRAFEHEPALGDGGATDRQAIEEPNSDHGLQRTGKAELPGEIFRRVVEARRLPGGPQNPAGRLQLRADRRFRSGRLMEIERYSAVP